MKSVIINNTKLIAIIVANGNIPLQLTNEATTFIQLHNMGVIDKAKLRSWKV